MMNGRMEERRAFVAEVDVLHASEPAPRRLWGNNLSEKGMFLQGGLIFRQGQRLSLRFDLRGHEIFVRAAEVIWVREDDEGQDPTGIGIHFNDIDPDAREIIRTYVLETDLDTSPPDMNDKQQNVLVSKITQVPSPRPGFAASLLPLKSPRPVTMRPTHRSVVQNLSHAVTLLRRAPQLSVPPTHKSFLSFLEPSESELYEARSQQETQVSRQQVNLTQNDMLFSDESPSLYEQETAVLEGVKSGLKNQWEFDDQPSGLRALDGKDEDAHQSAVKRQAPEEPAFLHYAKEVKKEQLFEHGDLSAAALPKAYERRAQLRRQKKMAHLRNITFWVAMGLVGYYLQSHFLGSIGEQDFPSVSKPPQQEVIVKQKEILAEPVIKETASKADLMNKPTAVAKKVLPAAKASVEDISTQADLTHNHRIEKTSGKMFYKPSLKTEWGRAHIGIKGGKVVRSFGLIRPPRVVVDLEGAKHPGNLTFKVQKDGIEKIRIGRPDGKLVRIVILTKGTRKPREISSLKRKDKLSIAWK